MKTNFALTSFYLLALFFIACNQKTKSLIFSAIGDVPYSNEAAKELRKNLLNVDNYKEASFLIHLGDIKSGAAPCVDDTYRNVAEILKLSKIPVFIIPGDNEWNDCENPSEAFELWNKYFFHFHENWNPSWEIEYQPERKENFAWVQQGVLIVGLNLVGGRVNDQDEWDDRQSKNAEWINSLIHKNKKSIASVIILGHANMNNNQEKFKTFTEKFRSIASKFKKPILYLHGDGHHWINDRPWKEQNIQRIQVDAGASILQVKVFNHLQNPFFFQGNGAERTASSAVN